MPAVDLASVAAASDVDRFEVVFVADDGTEQRLPLLQLDRSPTPREYAWFVATPWSRPHPQPSPFLDAAAPPIGWAERDHRPATGGRPLLERERLAVGTFPVHPHQLRAFNGSGSHACPGSCATDRSTACCTSTPGTASAAVPAADQRTGNDEAQRLHRC